MQIAQNPARNVAKLNILRSASPGFVPTLGGNTPPSDWTIAIAYNGGGLNSPQGVAVDQAGNVWVANAGNNSVSQFAATGAPISGTTGYTAGINAPYAVAIDQAGHAWVANSGNNSIAELSSTGSNSATSFSNGLNVPKSIAIDASGNVFTGNSAGGGISGFNSSGDVLQNSPITGGGVNAPVAVIISPR